MPPSPFPPATRLLRALACAVALLPASAEAPRRPLPGARSGTGDPFALALPPVRRYGMEHGLPDGSVYSLAWDPRGRLWAATRGGAARFDGQAWTAVKPPETKGAFRTLLFAPDGTLWCGSEHEGLWRLAGGQWSLHAVGTGINHLLETRTLRPGLWAGTRGRGVLRWEGGRWVPAGLPELWVWQLLESPGPDGVVRLWAATSRGLWALDASGTWSRMGADLPFLNETNCLTVEPLGGGRFALWAGCWRQGVARWDGGPWHLQGPGSAEAFPSRLPTSLQFDPDGFQGPVLWASTYDHGLAWFQGGRWQVMEGQGGPGFRETYATLLPRGRRPSIWFGGRGRGVGAADLGAWRLLDERAGLDLDAVTALAEDDGGLWVGGTRGLVRVDGGGVRAEREPGGPASLVTRILPEPDGRLWVATMTGLHLREGGRWRPVDLSTPGGSEGSVFALLRGRDRLWVGTSAGLRWRIGDRWEALTIRDGMPGQVVYSLCEAPRPKAGPEAAPDLWVGTRDAGVLRLRDGHWSAFPLEGPSASKWCNELLPVQGKDGRWWLWASFVDQGLGRLELGREDKGWRVWSPADIPGFPVASMFNMARHPDGRLYLGTAQGVVRLTLAEGPDGPVPGGVELFGPADGVPAGIGAYFGRMVDRRGRVWMGTDQGLAVLDPAAGLRPESLPPPFLDRLEVDGTSMEPVDGFRLAPGRRRLRVDFGWTAYPEREAGRFRTQLEGWEAAPGPWRTDAHQEFTGLPPGRYRLLVWAQDRAGRTVGPTAWSFQVLPPLWGTWWARALAALGLVGAGALAMRLLDRCRVR